MNRRGQLAMLGIMLAVMMLIGTIVLIEPIRDQVTIARASLDCTNSSISTGTQMTCIIVDWQLPVFIGVALSVAMGFIALRNFRAGSQQ